jgi:dipeptidyl aminopeptidase/acylaminoacyl peptidase
MDGPQLSPKGTHVAARLNASGQQVFAIIGLFDKSKPRLIGLNDQDLLDWSWVNDDWLVFRLGTTVNVGGIDFYVRRVVSINAATTKMIPIARNAAGESANIIWTATDGSPQIAMTIQKSIYINEPDFWPDVSMIDVTTGRARVMVPPRVNFMQWVADPTGVVRMGFGYDDQKRTTRLLYRPDGSSPFRQVDRADARKKESLTTPILLAGTGGAVTVADPDGFDALYDIDLSTLSVGKRLYGAEGYDIDNVLLSPDGTRVTGVSYTSDRARTHWMDGALSEAQAQFDKAVGPARTASIVSLSRDQSKMLIWVGDASQPGSYYYYDASVGGAMTRVASVNSALRASLGPVSTYRYKARDGLSIEAVLTLPNGREAKRLPLILMPHGGPGARDSASYDWWAQFLADRGYAVVQPNYRGSTGYGDVFRDAGDGEWGLKMQDDLNDAVADLAAKGTIDAKRVCIVGASYGGYAAMRGAQRDGDKFRCAISYAGVSDLAGIMNYDSGFLNGNSARDYWKRSATNIKDVSPINHAATFSAPILIMHGKKDLRVPVSQSRRMVARLKDAGKPVDYIEQPEGDHHFSRQADRQQFLEAIEAFLKKHNPA